MTSQAAPVPGASFKAARFDPFRAAWGVLTNVKVALTLIALAVAGGSLGVVIPQVPAPMRGNAAARSAWMELRREDFGGFTGLMDRLYLFDVFYSPWFNGLWLLIILAVTVSTVSRFRPTWRSVHRPPRAVPDRYFQAAHHRASFSHTGGAEAVEGALRRRRYRVERTGEVEGVTYLFAQRYAWGAYGTFLSHLALLIFLVGALLTRFVGFDTTLALAEGTPAAPVFRTPGTGQIFVGMADAHRGTDAVGNVIDFHSDLVVTRGDEAVTCKATVNDPCHAFGYKFHQAAFFDDIARLRVVTPEGKVAYDDIVDFDNAATAVPVIEIRAEDGSVLLNQELPQMASEGGDPSTREDDVALGAFVVPGTSFEFVASWRVVDGRMRVALTNVGGGVQELRQGVPLTAGPYRITFAGARSIPAMRIDDLPGAGLGGTVVQMARGTDGAPYLFVVGAGGSNLLLREGEAVTGDNGYVYTFGGRVEASGINIKRDPGDTFIWLAVGMAIVGLGITFYVPRRRLWARVTATETQFAGIAERTTRFGRELRMMGAELGSRDAIRPEDIDERY